MRSFPFVCVTLLLTEAALCCRAAEPTGGSQLTYRFDMGSEPSPVAPGRLRITPDTYHSPERHYGWESRDQTAFDVPRPAVNPAWKQPAGQVIPEEFIVYKEHTDVTRDGVSSRKDLQFRVDLPNGDYGSH